ncbi:PREDICTED: uncharacterized protein LOC105451323 [Wasmannia auropunctata]|uniref:uncharacterized protein LOC105451323 n=1 Tax=Wasmannia auropunctata TaxID=64793 RepID=UPI0005EF85F9|nr:PREDICTED: uncharacterized protein LOC105451323 [Wasmannia auropunctata]
MDSGSTSHMSRSMEGMKIMEKIESNVGLAKSNESMKAKATRNLTTNLLSVNAITNNGGTVTFTNKQIKKEYLIELRASSSTPAARAAAAPAIVDAVAAAAVPAAAPVADPADDLAAAPAAALNDARRPNNYYPNRSEEFELMSLYEFAQWYDITKIKPRSKNIEYYELNNDQKRIFDRIESKFVYSSRPRRAAPAIVDAVAAAAAPAADVAAPAADAAASVADPADDLAAALAVALNDARRPTPGLESAYLRRELVLYALKTQ